MLLDCEYEQAKKILEAICPQWKLNEVTFALNELPADILARLQNGSESIDLLEVYMSIRANCP